MAAQKLKEEKRQAEWERLSRSFSMVRIARCLVIKQMLYTTIRENYGLSHYSKQCFSKDKEYFSQYEFLYRDIARKQIGRGDYLVEDLSNKMSIVRQTHPYSSGRRSYLGGEWNKYCVVDDRVLRKLSLTPKNTSACRWDFYYKN